jgi:VPDSG-CTERM motif
MPGVIGSLFTACTNRSLGSSVSTLLGIRFSGRAAGSLIRSRFGGGTFPYPEETPPPPVDNGTTLTSLYRDDAGNLVDVRFVDNSYGTHGVPDTGSTFALLFLSLLAVVGAIRLGSIRAA